MLLDEREQMYWKEYTAMHLWMLTGAVFGLGKQELKTPPYSEIMHPERADKRSADEIKQDILKKLLA